MVQFDQLEIRSYKKSVPNTFIRCKSPKGAAIMFPGMGYTCHGPLLYYTTLLLEDLGYDVLQLNYKYDGAFSNLPEDEQEKRFNSDIEAAYDAVAGMKYGKMVLIGKSLGTEAMVHLLNARKIKNNTRLVWLTPVLNNLHVMETLKEKREFRERSIVITGTNDRYFDTRALSKMRKGKLCKIIAIRGADHSLDAGTGYSSSIKNIKTAVSKIGSFLSVES